MDLTTRLLTIEDAQDLTGLYRAIAAVPNDFLRTEEEVGKDYVDRSLKRGSQGGVAIGAFERGSNRLIGAITARRLGLKVHEHILSNVIIGVHPEHQRKGIGRRLFLDFLEHVQMNREDILRVELIARDSNQKQIEFYESIGFRREGYFENRIKTASGFEADVPMAWLKREL